MEGELHLSLSMMCYWSSIYTCKGDWKAQSLFWVARYQLKITLTEKRKIDTGIISNHHTRPFQSLKYPRLFFLYVKCIHLYSILESSSKSIIPRGCSPPHRVRLLWRLMVWNFMNCQPPHIYTYSIYRENLP